MQDSTRSTPPSSSSRARLVGALPVKDEQLELAGLRSAVLEGGGGPPIVLLHGPGGYGAHWMRIIPALVRRYHVVAPDLPGHGRTELGSEILDVRRVFAWLADLIEQTCAAPPILLGELVGGAIAARFAAAHPSRVSRLVLVDTFGLQPFAPTPEFGRALGEFGAAPSESTHQALWGLCAHDLPALRRELGSSWEPFEAYNVERARSASTQAAIGALMAEFGAPAISPVVLEQLSVPTTLIWGRHDMATPISVARAASAKYRWPLYVIEDANDAPAMEQPEAFLRVLLGDLSRPPWRQAASPDRGRVDARGREHIDTLVIGGGQAGLATTHWLRRAGIDHLVLERRAELGGAWHDRWDSFQLVSPNFCLLLPGMHYGGSEPDAFMSRDEVIHHLQAYGEFCAAPVRLGQEVKRLSREGDGFVARTSAESFVARQVVLATGPYQRPKVPAQAALLSPHIQQIHSHEYRRAAQLADGAVLVVGSGQSGTQIADELARAGREVHLALSMCPSVPRSYRGRDIIWWLLQSFQNRERLHLPFPMVHDLPTPAARFACNPHLSTTPAGRDISLRRLARQGMHLYGRLEDVEGTLVTFSGDLAERLTFADEKFDEEFRPLFDAYISAAGVDAPPDDRGARDDFVPPLVTQLDLDAAGILCVIWATGYRLDFGWVDLPIFDEWGYPRHQRGVTECPGLYAVGLPWLYSEPSSVLGGVGDDAAYVVDHLAQYRVERLGRRA
jgi:putative flavoprotein involved in K+ transport